LEFSKKLFVKRNENEDVIQNEIEIKEICLRNELSVDSVQEDDSVNQINNDNN
jgi:hypothetical protein